MFQWREMGRLGKGRSGKGISNRKVFEKAVIKLTILQAIYFVYFISMFHIKRYMNIYTYTHILIYVFILFVHNINAFLYEIY